MDCSYRQIIAAVLRRASLDYLLGLPSVWKWLVSDEAEPFFDALDINRTDALAQLKKRRKSKEVIRQIQKDILETQKEISVIVQETGYNIRERYKKG